MTTDTKTAAQADWSLAQAINNLEDAADALCALGLHMHAGHVRWAVIDANKALQALSELPGPA